MKFRILFVCAIAAAVGAVELCWTDAFAAIFRSSKSIFRAEASRSKSGELPKAIKWLEVENRLGELKIVADDKAPGWKWNLRVMAPTEASAQSGAEEAKIQAERSGDGFRLVVSLPNKMVNQSFNSDLEVHVPGSVVVRGINSFGKLSVVGLASDVSAKNQNGQITLQHVKGKVTAQTSFAAMEVEETGPAVLRNQNGSITASGIQGPLEMQSSFAAIAAHDIAGAVKARNQNGQIQVIEAKGDIDLKTSFGAIRAEKISGGAILLNQNGSISGKGITGSVEAKTSFASIELDSNSTKFDVQNQNGPIRIRAVSPKLARIDARTSFGGIELRLPTGLKPAIAAQTSFAKVDSDFPVLTKGNEKEAFREVEPNVPRIVLHNQNGGIRVIRE